MPANSIAPARQAAFDILRKVGQELGNSDSLLHSQQVDALPPSDRNLCTALVLGTLRWQRVLDAECRRFLSRPNMSLPDDAHLALRLGAYQLLFLDRIPAHAAIFESVEWMKQSHAPRQAGLVNAVLRKVSALPKPRIFDAELAYPEWMVARWRKLYGKDACRTICENGQEEPRPALRLLTSEAASALASAGIQLEPASFLTNARCLSAHGEERLRTETYSQIQDEGSQLVGELLGHGERILDCCAAPGGKTAILRQNNPEAQLLVCDSHPGRLATLQQRLGEFLSTGPVEFRVADAAKLGGIGAFDRILCDVPCSSTGTLGRNPEIRHRLEVRDLTRQARRQREILSSALRLLASGGRLLYSTCSLEPEENEQVVEACLRSANVSTLQFRRTDLRAEWDRLEAQGASRGEAVAALGVTAFRGGYLRTLPGMHPCDGFFAAMIEHV